MKTFRVWAALAFVLVFAVGGGWAFWTYEMRWWPTTIVRHQVEIVRILESAGWASPGLKGKRLYMISYADCAACARYQAEEFSGLRAKDVDTRVIVTARRDENGRALSTPVERATVAQVWLTHDWKLLQAWQAAPGTWTGKGVPTADGDMARDAVVEASRKMVDDLKPLLKTNGLKFGYPMLVWWDEKGQMRACACDTPRSYRYVRKELGV